MPSFAVQHTSKTLANLENKLLQQRFIFDHEMLKENEPCGLCLFYVLQVMQECLCMHRTGQIAKYIYLNPSWSPPPLLHMFQNFESGIVFQNFESYACFKCLNPRRRRSVWVRRSASRMSNHKPSLPTTQPSSHCCNSPATSGRAESSRCVDLNSWMGHFDNRLIQSQMCSELLHGHSKSRLYLGSLRPRIFNPCL